MRIHTGRELRIVHKDSVWPGSVPSTGSMQTLPMTDKEKEEAGKKVKIVGFAPGEEDA